MLGYAWHLEHHDQLATAGREWRAPDDLPKSVLYSGEAPQPKPDDLHTAAATFCAALEDLHGSVISYDYAQFFRDAEAQDGFNASREGGVTLWAMVKVAKSRGAVDSATGERIIEAQVRSYRLQTAADVSEFLRAGMGPVLTAVKQKDSDDRRLVAVLGVSPDGTFTTLICPHWIEMSEDELEQALATELTPCVGLTKETKNGED